MQNGEGATGAVISEAAYEGGSGSTLLLLHGLGGTWHIWKPVLALLERHHRVVALTLPGHWGGPELPAGATPSVDLLADVLAEDLRRRGIVRPHVAGNSLGGWLSLELARRGLVSSVTALSPAGGWNTPEAYAKVEKPFRIVFGADLERMLSGLAGPVVEGDRLPARQGRLKGDDVPPLRIVDCLDRRIGELAALTEAQLRQLPFEREGPLMRRLRASQVFRRRLRLVIHPGRCVEDSAGHRHQGPPFLQLGIKTEQMRCADPDLRQIGRVHV
jgi:pimeloyl-ACP methyl ester carboxylesterase